MRERSSNDNKIIGIEIEVRGREPPCLSDGSPTTLGTFNKTRSLVEW